MSYFKIISRISTSLLALAAMGCADALVGSVPPGSGDDDKGPGDVAIVSGSARGAEVMVSSSGMVAGSEVECDSNAVCRSSVTVTQ